MCWITNAGLLNVVDAVELASYWWVLAGSVFILGALAIAFRARVARLVRLAKAVATDQRLPRSVRWTFRLALAVKLLPVDFGVDEALMLIGVVLLLTRHRETFATIRAEIKAGAGSRESPGYGRGPA